jgi:hypothetical protein
MFLALAEYDSSAPVGLFWLSIKGSAILTVGSIISGALCFNVVFADIDNRIKAFCRNQEIPVDRFLRKPRLFFTGVVLVCACAMLAWQYCGARAPSSSQGRTLSNNSVIP